MKRKILTLKGEDIIPYVDGYGVSIGGTNLVDYLDQIEETFSKALLFLGAFASESALLTAYPNGSDLEDGTYAIVADTDTLYIYDTEGEEWLPTASNISGIMELNGLTPVSGALTITGGDINSTVSSADTQTQTITAHLNTLYEENDAENESISNLYQTPIGIISGVSTSTASAGGYDYIVYNGTLNTKRLSSEPFNEFHGTNYALIRFRTYPSATGEERIKISLNSGAKTYTLAYLQSNSDGSGVPIKYKELYARLGFRRKQGSVIYGEYCLVELDNYYNQAYIVDFKHEPLEKHEIATITSASWSSAQGGGYVTQIGYSSNYDIAPNCYVLSVSKLSSGKYTTAIVDYEIDTTYHLIKLYSDEVFDGVLVYLVSFK